MQPTYLRAPIAALALLSPIAASLLAPPASAQQRAVVGSSIHALAVQANGLGAGSVFQFEVQATPNGRAAEVEMVGQRITVPLREVAYGVYQGAYTVKPTELIQTHGQLAVRVTHGDQTVSRRFAFPPEVRALANPAPPVAGPASAIERFVMRPMGRLSPGRELRFRVHGAPGGEAWVDIPGVINRLELDETRPGVYEGEYTVRRRDDLDAFPRAVATLQRGDQRVTARLMRDRDDRRDATPPAITVLAPAQGERIAERGRTRISAKIGDEGRGIDTGSIRLRIDGRDVSRDVRFADNEVRYSEDLPPGRHTAELTVRDLAGNEASKSWSFEVVDRAAPPPPAAGLPLQVTSHANGGVIEGASLNLRGRTAPNASVRVQIEYVLGLGGVAIQRSVVDQTVQADAAGNFQLVHAPGVLAPGRYEVRVTSTSGSQVAEQRLSLVRQG